MSNNVDKLWKQCMREQQKRIKPGECQKYVRLVLDSGFMQDGFGAEVFITLNEANLKYEIRNLHDRNCILWERSVGQRKLDINTGDLEEEWQLEQQVIRVLNENEFQRAMNDPNLLKLLAERLQNFYPDCKRTFIVPQMRDKHGRHAAVLVELQVLQQLNIVQLPMQPQELVAQLNRYTKAIAEAPYKAQRAETLGGFKKYLANDKKQCVRVENGNGYGRLWQQHLNRLPLVTLEVAEAIIAQYPCPNKLIKHLERDAADAITTLSDLKINRAGQPLQSDRRVGNVLSGKLQTLYTAIDPNAQL